MNSNTIFYLLFLVGLGAFAQQKTSSELQPFEELKVFDKINVILVRADQNRITISGPQKDEIAVVEKAGVLKLKMSLDNLWDEKDATKVTIFYTTVKTIDANEGASVLVKDSLVQESLKLSVQEGAKIKGKIVVKKLVSKAVTGGVIEVHGSSNNQDITIKAGGQYETQKLVSDSTHVSISAGGRASINAKLFVKATTTAGGTIKIYGSPRLIDSKKVFGGKIIEIN
ncbi:head GIN domain-containing protein [Aquimarina sp. 2-A2]|uniref:head GIN domain-containing protein n=1 Tax=Aquimarina sp. 2-A2 TaxID=3382644 RepID=UPI00387F027D